MHTNNRAARRDPPNHHPGAIGDLPAEGPVLRRRRSRFGFTCRKLVEVLINGVSNGRVGERQGVRVLAQRCSSVCVSQSCLGLEDFASLDEERGHVVAKTMQCRTLNAGPGAAAGPAGSAAIEQMFHDYFASQGLASSETAFSGRSDYGPFIAPGVGIPSGGLFTGAEGIKTPEEASIFGGTAGVAYDPCYHLACDTFANVSQQGLEEMADAVAHVTLTLAFDTKAVNGNSKGHPVSAPGQATTGTPVTATPSGGGLHDDDHAPVTS